MAAPPAATIGHELTYTLTVANTGPGPASGVVLTAALPAGATIVAAGQTQCLSAIGSYVVMTALGGLAVEESATVTIVVIPAVAGVLEVTVADDRQPAQGDVTTPLPIAASRRWPAIGSGVRMTALGGLAVGSRRRSRSS